MAHSLNSWFGRGNFEREVEIAIIIDGANLSKRLSHVTAGIKVIDKYAKDPLTGNYFLKYATDPDGNDVFQGGYQTRDNCYPFLVLMAKETYKVYNNQNIVEFFKFFEEVGVNGIRGSKPIKVSSPQDMALTWKAVGEGGGSGTKKHFCHF